MTITEHLEFSVLSAPIAALDRRALSQAWYSALYGAAAPVRPNARAPKTSACAKPVRAPAQGSSGEQTAHVKNAASRSAAGRQTPVRGLEFERRAPRSALARKIERTFLHPRACTRKAAFTIDGAGARVQILLQSSGGKLKLVAICPPKAEAHVAEALAQARYALALRGIAVSAETRSNAS